MRLGQLFNLIIPVFLILTWVETIAQVSIDHIKPAEISISDAIANDMMEVSIHGAFNPSLYNEVLDQNGVHFGKCICIMLKSKVDSIVLIRLDCGTQLIPEDTSVQTMIVTQNAIFPLYPNEAYTTRFYAMCGQLHDGAPTVYSGPY